jgi:hypothetical protein
VIIVFTASPSCWGGTHVSARNVVIVISARVVTVAVIVGIIAIVAGRHAGRPLHGIIVIIVIAASPSRWGGPMCPPASWSWYLPRRRRVGADRRVGSHRNHRHHRIR